MATVVHDVAAVRAALGDAEAGLVPTMGALHAGHLALIRRAAAENQRTVLSVFVNPTQFFEPLDLARYPRDLDHDVTVAASAGADLVYAPPVEVVYPPGFAVTVDVARLTEAWEGASRPGHFRGVATVVSVLLNSVRPARSYFGEKDFQQLVVVRRLHRDLVLPGEIVGCPTVRDEDGLALSSRNVRLSPEARQTAVAIPRAMFAMQDAAGRGVRSIERLITIGRRALIVPGLDLDYLAVVDAGSLAAVPRLTPGARAIVAATVGGVRLIDNVELGVRR
ncbi:MAG: pantoate--beta-alanine ligase [Thermomicrobiales bacterium]